jgi:mannose-6-phosphate isomerase-like protein (cupin superfamily)
MVRGHANLQRELKMPKPLGWERKPWGWSKSLGIDREPESPFRIVCRRAFAEIDRGGFSSIHRHDIQSNAFFVLEGRLIVTTHSDADRDEIVSDTDLRAGDQILIEPKILHRFLAVQFVRLLEVYVPMPGASAEAADIHRLTDNGLDESLVLRYE